MMIKLLCLLETAKLYFKHMAFMLLPNFNAIKKRVVAPNLTRVDPRVRLLV